MHLFAVRIVSVVVDEAAERLCVKSWLPNGKETRTRIRGTAASVLENRKQKHAHVYMCIYMYIYNLAALVVVAALLPLRCV